MPSLAIDLPESAQRRHEQGPLPERTALLFTAGQTTLCTATAHCAGTEHCIDIHRNMHVNTAFCGVAVGLPNRASTLCTRFASPWVSGASGFTCRRTRASLGIRQPMCSGSDADASFSAKREELSIDRTSLLGRVAVVTGGHRGVGESISLALAAHGADVVVLDRGGAASSPVPSLIKSMNREHWGVTVDLADAAAIERACKSVWNIVGERGVDILVNNAGVSLLDPLESLSTDDWDMTMAINVRAPLLLAQNFVKGKHGMLAKGKGVIINISSAASFGALDKHGAYCSSKAGLNMLTYSMSAEWAAGGIRAVAVAPTVIMTEMGKRVWGAPEVGAPMLAKVPAGRFAEPYEVSDVVAFLASDAACMINGTVVTVDGGYNAL